jgi:sporulation integral membrane protein YtvI
MKFREENAERIKGFIVIALITTIVYLGFRFLLPLIFPFIIAYFLAWIIRPTTEFLFRRLKLPRLLGGTISLLILLGVLCTGLYFLFSTIIKQAVNFIINIPVYMNLLMDRLDDICYSSDKLFGFEQGTALSFVEDNLTQMLGRVRTNLMPNITEQTIALTITLIGAIGIVLIIFVSALLIVKDLPLFRERNKGNQLYQDFHKVTKKLSDAGIAYLRSQVIIMVIVAFLCVLGLTILRNEYALLLGVGIAIMDALPIIGSGIVFIPWSIVMLINGNIYAAAILITIYLLCQIIREVLEPKLIGSSIGIKPIFTIVSMYVGVKLFGVSGFFLGPIGLVIIITIYNVINEKSGKSNKNEKLTCQQE